MNIVNIQEQFQEKKSLFFFAIDYLFVSLLKKDIDLTIKKPEKNPKNLLAFILFFYS